MRRTAILLALACLLAACAKESSNTKIVVAVWSDLAVPAELDLVRITFAGPSEERSVDFPLAAGGVVGKSALPVELMLVRGDNQAVSFTVRASGLLADQPVVAQEAALAFVANETRVLTLYLGRACAGVACGPSLTCAAGGCGQPIDVTSTSLPVYDPAAGLPPPPDAGAVPPPPDAAVATGGSMGTGGMLGAGGSTGGGGQDGTGGSLGAGGTPPPRTAGAPGRGGMIALGGVLGKGGALGMGGATAACQEGATQCSDTSSGLQTCTSGRWGAPVGCGVRQTCPAGAAKCTCIVDPVCTTLGKTCADQTTVASCAQDAQTCFYQQTLTTCTNGRCYGPAGSAACCTNSCTVGTGSSCPTSNSLRACTVGSNGCTSITTANCPTGLVCERIGTPDCVDPNWTQWPMPAAPADVAVGAPNPASYGIGSSGIVTDVVTKLMWQQAVPATTYAWADAVAYCPTLTLGGYSDWRLPTIIELVSIVDLGLGAPSINGTYFPSTPAAMFWSATPLPSTTTTLYARGIDFTDGRSNYWAPATLGNVRCVR